MNRWIESEVKDIFNESPSVKRIFLQPPEALDFKGGQFIVTDLPIHEKRTQRWRSYSIANFDPVDHLLELCVVKVENGKGSTFLCDQMKTGMKVTHKRPQGAFVLDKAENRKIIMICTGTGVAPFRSMVQEMIYYKNFPKELHLVFGSRTRDDLLYYREFTHWEKEYSWFHYHSTLSRDPQWHNYGYVHPVYDQIIRSANINDYEAYICGWPIVVDECVDRLLRLHQFDRKNIHFELYG